MLQGPLQRCGLWSGVSGGIDFNDERLARYDVVVWLNTASEVLNDPARRAFERRRRALSARRLLSE